MGNESTYLCVRFLAQCICDAILLRWAYLTEDNTMARRSVVGDCRIAYCVTSLRGSKCFLTKDSALNLSLYKIHSFRSKHAATYHDLFDQMYRQDGM